MNNWRPWAAGRKWRKARSTAFGPPFTFVHWFATEYNAKGLIENIFGCSSSNPSMQPVEGIFFCLLIVLWAVRLGGGLSRNFAGRVVGCLYDALWEGLSNQSFTPRLEKVSLKSSYLIAAPERRYCCGEAGPSPLCFSIFRFPVPLRQHPPASSVNHETRRGKRRYALCPASRGEERRGRFLRERCRESVFLNGLGLAFYPCYVSNLTLASSLAIFAKYVEPS